MNSFSVKGEHRDKDRVKLLPHVFGRLVRPFLFFLALPPSPESLLGFCNCCRGQLFSGRKQNKHMGEGVGITVFDRRNRSYKGLKPYFRLLTHTHLFHSIKGIMPDAIAHDNRYLFFLIITFCRQEH